MHKIKKSFIETGRRDSIRSKTISRFKQNRGEKYKINKTEVNRDLEIDPKC